MRMRNIKNQAEMVQNNKLTIEDPTKLKGQWDQDYFKNQQPVHVEFGMGKGGFLSQLAEANPKINYVGFEKFTNILVRTISRFEEDTHNVALVRYDVENIEEVFDQGEVERVYLNFSDPWPKDRHAKRRLTHRNFLNRYAHILGDGGEVHFKTDNESLFDFSLEEFEAAGWTLQKVTRDLHNSPYTQGNFMTEYEERYHELGQPIFRLEARKPGSKV